MNELHYGVLVILRWYPPLDDFMLPGKLFLCLHMTIFEDYDPYAVHIFNCRAAGW